MFREMVGVVEDICSGTATKRHALIYGDPGVGKTYECTRAAQRSLDKEKYKYKYYKGNVGKSMTDCAAFFYKYHDMYVIMLDDNDAMIMKGAGQQVNLFFKAILSPEARETPIKIPSTIQSKATDALEQLADSKQIRFRIDREALRENTFRLY
jgi:chromosomal replication initiation ATPase DnaA